MCAARRDVGVAQTRLGGEKARRRAQERQLVLYYDGEDVSPEQYERLDEESGLRHTPGFGHYGRSTRGPCVLRQMVSANWERVRF